MIRRPRPVIETDKPATDDELKRARENMRKSDDPAVRAAAEKLDKKDKNAFSKFKCIVGGMIKYAGKSPETRTEEDCGIDALTLWEISVADIANLSVENAKAQLGKSIITKNDFKNK